VFVGHDDTQVRLKIYSGETQVRQLVWEFIILQVEQFVGQLKQIDKFE